MLMLSNACWAQGSGQSKVDVRLVIDVSGSMKRNDPKNLREPAVDLLVRLLPESSRAGVWTFGKYVNMLVPHQTVNDDWRDMAREKAQQINSVGLFTNIGGAIETAAHDRLRSESEYQTSLILLTDGMVDIDKDPQLNQKEWQRIAKEILPELKAGEYMVHTIALSENADNELLEKMAVATDGVAAVAKNAEDLMAIFLKAFNAAAPAEQVPLEGNSFVVDSSVEEFTALAFRQDSEANTTLMAPDDQRYDAQTTDPDFSWFRSPTYDLITVKQPFEGEWHVKADLKPSSRITVVSDLSLKVKPLPNNVFRDVPVVLSFMLREDGKKLKNKQFLSLLVNSVDLQYQASDDEKLSSLWTHTFDPRRLPENGVFSIELPAFEKMGNYKIILSVDGKTFKRRFEHNIGVRQPFVAKMSTENTESGTNQYQINVVSYSEQLEPSQIQVIAAITKPNRRRIIKPLRLDERGAWEAIFTPELIGEYQVDVKVTGAEGDGAAFEYALEPLKANFDPNKAFTESIEEGDAQASPEKIQEPEPEPEPEPQPEPEPEPIVEKVDEPMPEEAGVSEEPNVLEEEGGLPSWMIYSFLAVGNFLLIGLGYFIFRKIFGTPPEEDVAADETNEAKSEPVAAAPEPKSEPQPMSEPEPELLEEPVEEMEMENTEFAMDTADDEEDEPPMEDLEAPAEANFEDEMLNAEGLDLADEGIDESIASLLEELESPGKKDTGT